jgi:hypothetical protein
LYFAPRLFLAPFAAPGPSGLAVASLTDTFGVNLVARYTQSVLGFTGEDSVNFFPPAPEPLQSTQTDKQFFGRGEAVWSLFDGRFKNFFGLDYTDDPNRGVEKDAIACVDMAIAIAAPNAGIASSFAGDGADEPCHSRNLTISTGLV